MPVVSLNVTEPNVWQPLRDARTAAGELALYLTALEIELGSLSRQQEQLEVRVMTTEVQALLARLAALQRALGRPAQRPVGAAPAGAPAGAAAAPAPGVPALRASLPGPAQGPLGPSLPAAGEGA